MVLPVPVTLTVSTIIGATGVDVCASAPVATVRAIKTKRNLFMQPPVLVVAVCAPAEPSRMADPNDKVPGQAPGRYYVDSQCIDCDLCRETSPNNYTRNDGDCFSYVFKQPETPEEELLCKDAMDNCPVEAIGNDG